MPHGEMRGLLGRDMFLAIPVPPGPCPPAQVPGSTNSRPARETPTRAKTRGKDVAEVAKPWTYQLWDYILPPSRQEPVLFQGQRWRKWTHWSLQALWRLVEELP